MYYITLLLTIYTVDAVTQMHAHVIKSCQTEYHVVTTVTTAIPIEREPLSNGSQR